MTGAGDPRKKAPVPVQSIGNFVLDRLVAEGGWGRVYSAEHPAIGRRVAVKVLRADLASNNEALSRFFNEARAANQIQNEHVVEILDFGQLPSGQPYIIMEWLEGRSLAQLLALEGPLDLGRSLHILRQTAHAIEAAHGQGVVHRDLKPDNIYLIARRGDPDFVKLLDFGIAKLATPRAGSHKTGTGVPMGTPAYMSPEQCSGEASVDHRTDIYSFGVILYELATGQRPFQAEGLGALLLKQMTERPTSPAHLNPQVPASLERAIMRLLEKDPAMRPQSMSEVLHDLGWEPSQNYVPPPLPPPPGPARPLTGGPARPATAGPSRPTTGRPMPSAPPARPAIPRPIPPPVHAPEEAEESDDEATRVEASPSPMVDPALMKTALQRTMLQHGRPVSGPEPAAEVPPASQAPIDLRSTAPQWKNVVTEPEAPREPPTGRGRATAPAGSSRPTQSPAAVSSPGTGRTAAAPTGTPGRGTAAPAAPPGRGTAAPAATPGRGTAAPAAAPGRGTAAPAGGIAAKPSRRPSPLLFAGLGLAVGAVAVTAVLLSRRSTPHPPPPPVVEKTPPVEVMVTFHIVTEPTGGVIYDAEGKVLGKAPLDYKVPRSASKHTFLLRMPGFEPRRAELVADADREVKLQFAPPAEPPKVEEPSPAEPPPSEEPRPKKQPKVAKAKRVAEPKIAKEPKVKEPKAVKEPKEPAKKKKSGKPASSGEGDDLK